MGFREYYRCEVCLLVFMNPNQHLPAEEEKERYDSHKNNPEDEDYVGFLNRLVKPLSEYLKPGGRGLDFGCGPGPTISAMLDKKGFSVADYDPIYFSNKKLIEEQYDFITATEVVEHLYKPREVFQLLDQLLKPNESYLGIMTQVLESEESFETWWYHNDPTHVCFYQKETLEWLGDFMGWKTNFPVDNVVIYEKHFKQ